MRKLTGEEIKQLRDRTYHRRPELAVRSEEEARQFIDEVGFCFLFPVEGAELPNLWDAINGGTRKLPRHHHDRALGLAWNWKDTLPSQKLVFYAKLIKQKPTFISLGMFPYFYALSDNYGELEDYLESYQDGRMSEEAKRVYEVLISQGPSATGILRREAGLWGGQNSSRFERALVELQRGLKIAKCGISDANRWKYSYVYEVLLRWLPDAVQSGLEIKERDAMKAIIRKYLETAVVSTPEKIAHLFDWRLELTTKAVESLLAEPALEEVEIAGQAGRWLAVA